MSHVNDTDGVKCFGSLKNGLFTLAFHIFLCFMDFLIYEHLMYL